MQTSMLLGMFDWIGDFFKSLFDLFPKIIYLLYASLACVLDVLQLFFRKLAGLDVYFVDGKAVGGDLVTNFIAGMFNIHFEQNNTTFDYSALSTVFWAFVIFGVIICFACTLVAIIKSHYSYDDKSAKGPMQYVYTGLKSIINMVALPIIVVLGLYVSSALLTAVDSITSTTSSSVVSLFKGKENLLRPVDTVKTATGVEETDDTGKNKTYIYYDIFGFGASIYYGTEASVPLIPDKKDLAAIGASTTPFSGVLFKTAAYNGNRVRTGYFDIKTLSVNNLSGYKDGGLFSGASSNEELANMIDTAFACHLHLTDNMKLDYSGPAGSYTSMSYFTTWVTKEANSFSKFNIGLVWYYYDLWNFNFIVGFGALFVCVLLFINIILGLITRIFTCLGLFLIAPPIFGLTPMFPDNKPAKSWRENFLKQALMAYGAVLGMNIFFLLFPYFNRIEFFRIPVADFLVQTLIIIVGLITIKAFIATISGIIGGADANETGGKISEEVGQTVGKATAMTVGAAKGIFKAPKTIAKAGKAVKNKVSSAYHGMEAKSGAKKEAKFARTEAKNDLLENYATSGTLGSMTKEQVLNDAMAAGLSQKEAEKLWEATEKGQKAERRGHSATEVTRRMKASLMDKDKEYEEMQQKQGYHRRSGTINPAQQARYNAERTSLNARISYNRRIKSREDARYERNKSGLTDLWALTPFAMANQTFKGSKVYKEFMDKSGIDPATDWAKENAKTSEKINKKLDDIGSRFPPAGGGGTP